MLPVVTLLMSTLGQRQVMPAPVTLCVFTAENQFPISTWCSITYWGLHGMMQKSSSKVHLALRFAHGQLSARGGVMRRAE
jgi:hypothetical protein